MRDKPPEFTHTHNFVLVFWKQAFSLVTTEECIYTRSMLGALAVSNLKRLLLKCPTHIPCSFSTCPSADLCVSDADTLTRDEQHQLMWWKPLFLFVTEDFKQLLQGPPSEPYQGGTENSEVMGILKHTTGVYAETYTTLAEG